MPVVIPDLNYWSDSDDKNNVCDKLEFIKAVASYD